jgi:methylated-DNA-[protein]-cysteine S-methyltransferase
MNQLNRGGSDSAASASSRSHLVVQSPLGRLALTAEDGCLAAVDFAPLPDRAVLGAAREATGTGAVDPVLAEAAVQLATYFVGERREFDLPLRPRGTPFQLLVWAELRLIPYGETRTYGELAAAIGRPTAARAVGGANNRNPLAIIVPCHRVIGADGTLTGYAGGLEAKAALLALESGRPSARGG